MPVKTRRTCVLAMSRLTEDTVADMRSGERSLILASPLGPDMVIAWAPTEPNEHMPSDLRDALAWARKQYDVRGSTGRDPGFHYVIFDRDVDPLEDGCDLPIYGYEVPGAVSA